MPANLTDSNTFTDPIVVPTDGDALTGASNALEAQGLANRTRFLKNYADAIALTTHFGVYTVDGAAVASGSKFTLTQVGEFGGFSLAGNEVTVPGAGDYLISVYFLAASSSGAVVGLLALQDNGTPFFQAASYKQTDGGTNNTVGFSFTAYAAIAAPTSSHKISLASLTSNLSVLGITANAALIIKRLR